MKERPAITEGKNQMITISLNKIRAKSPCHDGWGRVLRTHKHLGMNAEFQLTSVLSSNDLADTIWCFECLPEYNWLWRKYAVWCARQVQHLMTDERSVNALDVAWRHSDGLATDDELAAARDAAWDAAGAARDAARAAARDAAWAARAAAGGAAWDAAWAARAAAGGAARAAAGGAAWAARDAARAARDDAGDAAWAAARDAARDAQQKKLVEILTAGEWVDDVEVRDASK